MKVLLLKNVIRINDFLLKSAGLKHFYTNTCFFKFIGNLIDNFNIEVEIQK